MLWTGGKDCALALDQVVREGREVGRLVTFVPPGPPRFRAHPLPIITAQAAALRLDLRRMVVRPPYRAGYSRAIQRLADEGVGSLVTGDIGPVDGRRNWIRECARGTGVKVETPLWGRKRDALLRETVNRGIDAVVAFIRTPPVPEAWLGRHLDALSVPSLLRDADTGRFDACGEQGEYHTWVVNCPWFDRGLRLRFGPPRRDGPTRSLSLRAVSTAPRPGSATAAA